MAGDFPKALAQRLHARKRARERYGLTHDEHLLAHIWQQIREQRALRVDSYPGQPRVLLLVRCPAGNDLFIAWDRNSKEVATFLPLHVAYTRMDRIAQNAVCYFAALQLLGKP